MDALLHRLGGRKWTKEQADRAMVDPWYSLRWPLISSRGRSLPGGVRGYSRRDVRPRDVPPWHRWAGYGYGYGETYYAIPPLHWLIRLWQWWAGARWCVERKMVDWGWMVPPYEACYMHELRWSLPWRRAEEAR